MFSFRIQSNSLATIAYLLDIISSNLLSTNDVELSKVASIKSIPSTAIELLLPLVEKYHNLKTEMQTVNVSLLKFQTFL